MKDLSEQEFENILYGREDIWKIVVPAEIVENSRWSIFKECVVLNSERNKYYKVFWEEGATESQECDLNASLCEVKPVQKVITDYVEVTKTMGY